MIVDFQLDDETFWLGPSLYSSQRTIGLLDDAMGMNNRSLDIL